MTESPDHFEAVIPSTSDRFLQATASLPSIDRSPILGQRYFAEEQQRMRTNSDILPIYSDAWQTSVTDALLNPNRLVAPIASPETLSDTSSIGGSRASLALLRRARRLWRRESIKASSAVTADSHRSTSDVGTESSSVYCASPFSSVRRVTTNARSSRAQLKREIMRLYQRAAADVGAADNMERHHQKKTSDSSYSTSSMGAPSHSRSASNSSASQPRMLTLDHMSPVFGVSTAGSFSSPTASRPATANGRRLSSIGIAQQQQQHQPASPLLPPCNTSL